VVLGSAVYSETNDEEHRLFMLFGLVRFEHHAVIESARRILSIMAISVNVWLVTTFGVFRLLFDGRIPAYRDIRQATISTFLTAKFAQEFWSCRRHSWMRFCHLENARSLFTTCLRCHSPHFDTVLHTYVA
jgi:hypothetical protein